jgi:hypothetical protein
MRMIGRQLAGVLDDDEPHAALQTFR